MKNEIKKDLRDMERLRASFRSRDGLYQRTGEAPERRVSATACRAAYATALAAATVLAAAAPWPDGWLDAPLRRGLALDARVPLPGAGLAPSLLRARAFLAYLLLRVAARDQRREPPVARPAHR